MSKWRPIGDVTFFGHARVQRRKAAAISIKSLRPLSSSSPPFPVARCPLKLEIDAEVPSGLDREKVRTLVNNADTLVLSK